MQQQQPRIVAAAVADGDAEDQLHPAIFMRRRQQQESWVVVVANGRSVRRCKQFFRPSSLSARQIRPIKLHPSHRRYT